MARFGIGLAIKHIAVDKTYFLTYKRTPNYLLLLTGVKENGIKK
ncbi:hypothetical protein OTSKATO_0922 [Orientia tsutsugamushi str. Kato PP]|uniref:Conjugal transfer protein TraE n=1 Tax=Orientia tsutsugamushi TaxID=784 RepID=A0A2U3QU86_ORITS|nr:hypothetical protein OTSKATO_0922 [Orientia tsutsugamushi str. Kato PP]SPR04512.1 conjugal transfer protein TraE [Orientia tsutsugamushi]